MSCNWLASNQVSAVWQSGHVCHYSGGRRACLPSSMLPPSSTFTSTFTVSVSTTFFANSTPIREGVIEKWRLDLRTSKIILYIIKSATIATVMIHHTLYARAIYNTFISGRLSSSAHRSSAFVSSSLLSLSHSQLSLPLSLQQVLFRTCIGNNPLHEFRPQLVSSVGSFPCTLAM